MGSRKRGWKKRKREEGLLEDGVVNIEAALLF